MQAALDEVEKPAKRGKKAILKKEDTEDTSSKPAKSKKRKADKGDSSVPKKYVGEKEEEQHEGSPRGNTPPRSPCPVENVNDSVSTPPRSPPKTTVQVSVAPPPPTSSQPTSIVAPPPPVCTILISTSPLLPPIISQTTEATITSIPIITTTIDSSVNVNISDVGAKTKDPPKVTPEPISPTVSSDSGVVLGGAEFEFDSTY
ncbi:hypothetical protein Lser_V15G35436 [Lactuca serriola]